VLAENEFLKEQLDTKGPKLKLSNLLGVFSACFIIIVYLLFWKTSIDRKKLLKKVVLLIIAVVLRDFKRDRLNKIDIKRIV
jgi:hypothetical protein